ncbi:family 78 glycoside hydrolase catalytic domain [Mucilaginibacter sp. HMF5004]|uniref:family 78 glycoside hydrolase catalytic domain n=1 Tax=Mucilaginibacter rivuli TaxID=2857527 RepID=UPI001C5D6313|nr:family 78 glycoside hydrolase catalytic domain [Mucilaginibacter rivuli]MBW4888333.1 family 78 glycoside hydrolase catalytic domain [Mucilaginibacter rivuli]
MKHRISFCFSAMLFLLLPFGLLAANPGKPLNLRCHNKYCPIGTEAKPYFGWYVNDADANEVQTAYQLQVSTNPNAAAADVWNSGKVKSDKQNYVYYAGKALLPATRYYWKVKTWDKDGHESPYSATQYFDTGLFDSQDWAGAKWVKRNTTDKDDYTYYRKTKALPAKTIKRAIAYISAVHNYEFYINGKFISKGSVNHYPQYQYYHAFDVTADIHPGERNLIAALTHWYGGGQGRAPSQRGFIMKTIIEYADGSKTTISTDSTWKQHQAEYWITGQPQRGGEGIGFQDKIDSRKAITNWFTAGCDDTAWPTATEIGAPLVAPWINNLQPDLTRVIEKEITPLSVTSLGGNKYLVDLGKIYAGIPVINFSGGNAGDMVSMRGGFVLNNDGTMNEKMNQSTNLAYYFILNGNNAVFKPMVYLGMRYLEIDNSPNVLTTVNVKFIMRHFELDENRSSFTSSNTMLNRVWELMKYSLVAGAQEGFVDTPTREKGSFLGDGWSEAVPAMSVMGDRVMNDRVLNEFMQSQDQYWPDGRLNSVYPNVDGKRDIPDYTQSYLVWVWDYYEQTGNAQFLIDNYTRLKKIADYVDRYKSPKTGLIHNLAGGSGPYLYGIIDWPSPMRYGYDMSTEARTVINAYAYIDFSNLSKIAGVVGNTADSVTYADKAMAIKKAINTQLINSNGVYNDGLHADLSPSTHTSQHANMYPMAMGIVPPASRDAVINEIKKQKMSVGMVTVRYLPLAIGEADQGAHLINLFTNTEWDGWAKNITQGATVTWESWDADKRNDSMSHPWGAVGLLGMEDYILGIKVLKAQHKLIQVKPLEFNHALDYAKGTLPTDRGDVSIEWKRGAKSYVMTLTIPANVKAKVYIPKSGTSGNRLMVDGKPINAVAEGNYLFAGLMGSGKHTFVRNAN